MDVNQQLFHSLTWINAAPKDSFPIYELCIRPIAGERKFLSSLELCPKRGVIGDRWLKHTWLYLQDGSPDPRLHVSILPYRVWSLICQPLQSQGQAIHPGDTIIADLDCSKRNLPVGQHLQAGTAILEVSDIFNGACKKWQSRYGTESITWFNQPNLRDTRLRGILCKIVKAGQLRRQDLLQKINISNTSYPIR